MRALRLRRQRRRAHRREAINGMEEKVNAVAEKGGVPETRDESLRADAMRAEAMRARERRMTAQGGPEKRERRLRLPKPVKPARQDAPRHDGVAVAHGGEEECAPKKRRHGRDRFARRLILVAIVLALIIVLVLILGERIDMAVKALSPDVSIIVPDSVEGILPDETMGYAAIDFTNAILGESRERKELVVMEQDVDVTSKISQDLLRLSIFAKAKIIRSYGTGVYTVALDEVGEEDVSVNQETKIISVTIPHTVLSYVNVDVERTEFEDTQKALLAIGDIKLTTEQKHMLDQSVNDALHERLNERALFVKADEIALNKVREILQPIVSSISEEYIVKIVMA